MEHTLSIDEAIEPGALYVVATPIGNLGDVSARVLHVLRGVALIAAEDTRHSGRLLRHFGIATPATALHEHNERDACQGIVRRLQDGEPVALISDAGTPLVSDPGFHLVRAALAAGVRVIPVPGPSALLAALCASGLATDRFLFEGFLPARRAARQSRLQALADQAATLVFYEAPHRVAASLGDMAAGLGAGRQASVGRELTKRHETFYYGTLGELAAIFAAPGSETRGEFVICVAGNSREDVAATGMDTDAVLEALLAELPLRRAVAVAVRITGGRRNDLYRRALELSGDGGG